MSEIPGDLKFLKSHEWARVEDDGLVRVGISDHAQGQLGDLVYVELPEVGSSVKAGTGAAVVESVKAASDIYAPVSGEVVEVNESLNDKPETINEDAYGDGWIFLVRPSDRAELDELLDANAYEELVESEDLIIQVERAGKGMARRTGFEGGGDPGVVLHEPLFPVRTLVRLSFRAPPLVAQWRRRCVFGDDIIASAASKSYLPIDPSQFARSGSALRNWT